MRSRFGGIACLLLILSITADRAEGQDDSKSPAEQYQALLKEYQRAGGSGRALTDEERLQFVGQVYKRRHELAVRFLELAERHPDDSIAVDALMQATWQVNTTPWPVELVGEDTASGRALAVLERDYMHSSKLGQVCLRISHGFRGEYEPFLRAVLETSPHRDVHGMACLGLAHYLNLRGQRLDLIHEQPALAGEFAGLYGADYLKELQRQDRAKATSEMESLFERAAKEYGDMTAGDGGGGTVGEKAAAELFEVRHLLVGRPAPEIEGRDQDGREFKLSDYRGKVVLLDFWSEA
jgi:hypothetical protein